VLICSYTWDMAKQKAKQKVIVSERALQQRINRKLSHTNQRLCRSRTARMEEACGRFFILDTHRNEVAFLNVDLEFQGRDLGVLAAWEELG